ncbi:MAG: flavodoxin family protein [Erysipelotrichaceae bacterium]|nr:flavodoxin family protein [Erysipelotrichaceae bacterium]
MKILMLTGSPHVNGTTALLADEFCAGAKESGHEVVRFNTSKMEIHPCIGCDHCRKHAGRCVFEDDMAKIVPELVSADAVVLVTPLYYFGMTAQLKRTVDRFYAVNAELRRAPKKLLLISAGSDQDDWAMEALTAHYRNIARYLKWLEGGVVLALGASNRKDLENSDYPQMAKRLGAGLA